MSGAKGVRIPDKSLTMFLLVMRNSVTEKATAARRLALRATEAPKTRPDLVPATVPAVLTALEEAYRRALAAMDFGGIDAALEAVRPAEREATHAEHALYSGLAASRVNPTGVRMRCQRAIDTCPTPSRAALPWRNP